MLTFRQILKKVQKPAYYTGGELGSVVKEKTPDLLRYAFAFPTPMISACPTWAEKSSTAHQRDGRRVV